MFFEENTENCLKSPKLLSVRFTVHVKYLNVLQDIDLQNGAIFAVETWAIYFGISM